jgi:hypothetical protein
MCAVMGDEGQLGHLSPEGSPSRDNHSGRQVNCRAKAALYAVFFGNRFNG